MSLNTTMKAQPFVVTPADYDPALNVLGTKMTVLASNAATQSYEITLQQGDEGTGPPPHSHNWDESFLRPQGQGRVQLRRQDRNVHARCAPALPAGTVNGFHYGIGGGEMLELTGQGGFATQMFTVISKEIPPRPP
jgi:quercetin dioxygenase-like cupin family protein